MIISNNIELFFINLKILRTIQSIGWLFPTIDYLFYESKGWSKQKANYWQFRIVWLPHAHPNHPRLHGIFCLDNVVGSNEHAWTSKNYNSQYLTNCLLTNVGWYKSRGYTTDSKYTFLIFKQLWCQHARRTHLWRCVWWPLPNHVSSISLYARY